MREHVRNAVGLRQQFRIVPAHALRLQRQPVAAPLLHMAVEQLGCAIEVFRKLQFGQIENELRQLRWRRKMVCREGIEVGGGEHNNDLSDWDSTRTQGCLSSSRAMMSCCTSLAPS
ncbi:hypothetical protein SDC9_152425 [bioreactor metagenome]|uniref:Uncharacterized protein n=1 Tax=bioreactor metagenome TaxID=1076179 RepID=A0A645ET27_9ZZZZ